MQHETEPPIIRFFTRVCAQSIAALLQTCEHIESSGVSSVTLLLSTGGATDQGLTAYNYIRACSLDVTTVNMGQVASIGAALYCAGAKRITMPNARFGFHPNVFNIKNESLGVYQLEEKANQLRVKHESIASIIASSTRLSVDDAKGLINEHRSLAATEAKDYGLAHDIEEFTLPVGCRVFNIQG